MPSRKKAKGKLRKAKAASKCCHGFPPNGEVSKIVSLLMSDFKSALPNVIEHADCPTSGYKCAECVLFTQTYINNFVDSLIFIPNLVSLWHPQFSQRHPQGEKVV